MAQDEMHQAAAQDAVRIKNDLRRPLHGGTRNSGRDGLIRIEIDTSLEPNRGQRARTCDLSAATIGMHGFCERAAS